MVYRELELTLLSARDLKNVNLITRMDVYAVVSISGDPLTRQCTAPDPYGGRNPCWNATLRFAVPPTAEEAAGASLHVLLRAERVLGDRDVGEVIVPLAEILAGAPPPGAPQQQQPQMAAYQVRKVQRWEPRGVLHVSYRLGPVVAPVAAPEKKPPQQPVVMAVPAAGVPVASQPPFRPPADAYSPPPRRSGAVRAAAEYDEKTMAPSPRAPATRNGTNNGGLGRDREGPTQVCVGPHTQIILGGPQTAAAGSNASSPRWNTDGARPKQHDHLQQQHHHDDDTPHGAYYYSPAQSTIISPREGYHSRPKVFSQHDTQKASSFQEAEKISYHQRAAPPSREQQPVTSPREASHHPPLSTFSAYPFIPSPRSSAHSSAPSPYSSPHPSTPSPRKPALGDAFGGNKAIDHTNSARSVSTTHRAAAASSPMSSSPLVANHSGMVPSR